MIGKLVLSLLFGLLFFWVGVSESIRMYRLYHHGLNAEGHVIKCVREVTPGAQMPHINYTSTVGFTDCRGKHVEFTEMKRLPVNQLVPVVYLPNNPRCAQVATAAVRWKELALITMCLIIFVLCFYFSIHIIFSLIRFRINL